MTEGPIDFDGILQVADHGNLVFSCVLKVVEFIVRQLEDGLLLLVASKNLLSDCGILEINLEFLCIVTHHYVIFVATIHVKWIAALSPSFCQQ